MHSLRPVAQLDIPVFSAPVRWSLRALTWAAFAGSAYLAWYAVTQTHVAGCGVSGDSGCDMVLTSAWSKWLGVPVAVPGLACYATLAALSVLLGVQSPRLGRWVNTAFVLLAVVAAAASVWFLLLQVVAIGHFCIFCIFTDVCGIAIGGLAVWSAARWLSETRYLRRSRTAASGLIALRTALPAGNRRAAPVAAARDYPTPSLAVALGGAGAIVVLLVGGQILFPAKGYEVQQVALEDTIEMDGQNDEEPAEPRSFEPDSRVAMRIPTEPEGQGDETDIDSADRDVVAAHYEESGDEPGDEAETGQEAAEESPSAASEPPRGPDRERILSFLDGKLKLDIYKHPHIGSPGAPHVFVEVVSYNCKHCRTTHQTMKRALSRYGNQVAVIVMVIPFEQGCNKLVTSAAYSHRGACSTARMALGVAALKPAGFAKFHDWLMADEDEPPRLDRVVARAYGLVNSERLRELSSSDRFQKQIESYVDLFATLQKQNSGKKEFGLPVQILGDHVMSGRVEKPADLHSAWEEHLGVKPR